MQKYFDPGQISALMRHVYTIVGTLVATLGVVGLSQGDATTIGTAVHNIGDGIVSIATGISALVPLASAAYAVWSSSRASKLKAMNADPEITKVVTVPGTTAASAALNIPGTKIT